MKKPKVIKMYTVEGSSVPKVDDVNTYEAYKDMIDALIGMCEEYKKALRNNFEYIDDLDSEYLKSIQALKKAGVEL